MHEDAFQVRQQFSPIGIMRYIHCSPQSVGFLAEVLLSVICLKTPVQETNIPSPILEEFDRDCHLFGWERPGGQATIIILPLKL